MSIIILDAGNGTVTVMPNTHEKGPHVDQHIQDALDKYEAKNPGSNIEWMEFEEPLKLNFL